MHLILLGEAFNRVVLVLMDALVEKSGHSDIERIAAAGKNVDPEFVIASVMHAGNRSTDILVETP
jgi:hypothetical protein